MNRGIWAGLREHKIYEFKIMKEQIRKRSASIEAKKS